MNSQPVQEKDAAPETIRDTVNDGVMLWAVYCTATIPLPVGVLDRTISDRILICPRL